MREKDWLLGKPFLVEGKKYRLKSVSGLRVFQGEEAGKRLVGGALTFVKEYPPVRDEFYFFEFATEHGKSVSFFVPDEEISSMNWSGYLEPL